MLGVSFVRLGGGEADVVLPSAEHDAFERYLERLEASAIFPASAFVALKQASARRVDLPAAPRIGIPVAEPSALMADEDIERLVALVKEMRCTPVLIPPCASVVCAQADRRAAVAAIVATLHGILGPGGDDVDPRIYKETRRPETAATNYPRDRFEADVALAGRAGNVFMFGICRSHQLWNAAFGGTLVQDMRGEGRSAVSQDQGAFSMPLDRPFVVYWPDGRIRFENRVRVTPKTQLAAIVQCESFLTNSWHHQAVDTVGLGMRVCGAVRDPETQTETIEATEDWNVMTTQFHPECMQRDLVQKRLLAVLGRRAHVLALASQLREPSLRALTDGMRTLSASAFSDADWEWAERELGARLAPVPA
ncbi:MAG: gamma-glutamyl-gamma-aminobutyrate hydrolase family protein [Deltaproteobacteria bacterium]|nr:gamma-glutamyl-gamma-aminobutyrate hydrolase family protein [Deltaproteobacteria bacterium]